MESYLARKGLFSAEMEREVAAGFTRELDAAIDTIAGRPTPNSVQAAFDLLNSRFKSRHGFVPTIFIPTSFIHQSRASE